MQFDLFDTKEKESLTEAMFQAYFDCRKNKRNTINALQFEKHFEKNIFQLCDEINAGTYQPGNSIAFIVNKPVMREVFAANFRDRVVHHFIYNKLNPLFEKAFINDSFACRIGKGTHFGIKRADDFIKACSKNYTNACYILKLDVQGFFMHINRTLLFDRLIKFIHENYLVSDKAMVIELCNKIIFNDPTKNCIIKGKRKEWEGLPQNKSLFHSPPDCGLPIGNLTSQVFANFYLNLLDHFITAELGINYYGRYVDDFIIVHENNEYLKNLIPQIAEFLQSRLQLTLHPNKIYLQHYSKGVKYLGAVIKPNRIYIAKRTKGNFYRAILEMNKIVEVEKLTIDEKAEFLSIMNSYLGILKHYRTYNLRRKMIEKHLSLGWWTYVYAIHYAKFRLKKLKHLSVSKRIENLSIY